jgi:hypothetical protein
MENDFLDSEFNKLVLNSNMPYNVHFYDFYGIIKILKNENTNQY